MTIEQIETRLAQILTEMDTPDADIDALTEEVRTLNAERDRLQAAAETRRQLREAVSSGQGAVVRSFQAQVIEDAPVGIETEEYRSIWLRHLRREKLSAQEQRAFTAANGAISTLVVNDIITKVRDHAPLLENVRLITSAGKIKYYVEGTTAEAAKHSENAAITPAADTLTPIELDPYEITKMIQVSKAAERMSIPAFDNWLTTTLAEAIARKINADIITAITTAATTAGADITADTVQALLGTVKGDGVALLVNRKTLFTKLLPLQDNSKSPLVRFEGTYESAHVYGVRVFVDDHVPDDNVLAADLRRVVAALAETVEVVQDYDIDTNSYKYLGTALFDVKVAFNECCAKLATA